MVEYLAPTPQLDQVFQALADPTRRAMVQHLATRAARVTDLAAPFKMSLAGASKHLRVLERAGIVQRTIHGRDHLCSLNAQPLAEAESWLRQYERFWNARLDALEALLQHPEPLEDKGAAP